MTSKRFLILGLLILLAGLSFFFGLRWFEKAVTFHPVRYTSSDQPLRPPGATDVSFLTADGLRLHGWFFASKVTPARATVIFFHGNSGNIANVGWLGEQLAARNFDVLVFDYRGYGMSEGATSDESGLYADADAAYEYVRGRGVPPERIVLYGQSLGTTAVADLASRRQCGAIILESGLSSASDMASQVLPWLPHWLHFVARNRFESARKLATVTCPVLVTHGEPDPEIPTAQGRKLFSAANEPRKLMIFPGAGHNVFGSQGETYLNSLAAFVDEALKRR
jgi:fermentation-respiration switch protein FrsA (DUF1100 family)